MSVQSIAKLTRKPDFFVPRQPLFSLSMYLVVIAWIYVALMMAVAEATHAEGTLLGALVTFVLYGAIPVAIVVYLMATPLRRKARRQREAAEEAAERASEERASHAPDGGGEPSADAVAPVRKET